MRLIDADIFKTEYENLITWVYHRTEKERLRVFIKDIQNQPTVKAIPIDWLLNQLLEDDLLEIHHAICCLWEKWKEENEKEL